MKFLNEAGQEITLKRSTTLPGYEVTLAEDTLIKSPVNNPFFKGINVLQLPKKLKGFRDNPDLKTLLEPQKVNTGIQFDLDYDAVILFEPSKDLYNKNMVLVNRVFGKNKIIEPMFVNFGFNDIKLEKGTFIGYFLLLKC